MDFFNPPKKYNQNRQQPPPIDVPAERIVDPPEPWQTKYKNNWGQYTPPAPPDAPKLPPGPDNAFGRPPKVFDGWNPYTPPDKYLPPSKEQPFNPPSNKPFNPPPWNGGGGAENNARKQQPPSSSNNGGGKGWGSAFAIAEGAMIGWEVGGWINENIRGQPQDITSEELEQGALERERQKQDNKNAGLTNLNPPKTYTISAPPTSPGQYFNKQYNVTVNRVFQRTDGSYVYNGISPSIQITGRILGCGWEYNVGGNGGWSVMIYYQTAEGGATQKIGANGSFTTTNPAQFKSASIASITRVDGGIDNGPTAPPISQNHTTNNTYNTNNYYSNNSDNYSNDAPFTPFEAGAAPGLKPKTSTNTNNANNTTGGIFKEPSKIPGLQSPAFSEPNPFEPTNDNPAQFPSTQDSSFPGAPFPNTRTYQKEDPVLDAQRNAGKPKSSTSTSSQSTPYAEPAETEQPKPFTGLPQGFLPPLAIPVGFTPTTTNKTGDLVEPTPTPTPQPENPPEYTPSQQMGQCCLALGTQNAANGEKIDNVSSKVNDNNNLLGALNALFQGVDLSLLGAIMTKLNAMDAWLIAKFAALWSHRLVDRALAAMNVALGIHNAVMLSNSIATTLGSALDNIGALIGIVPPEGNGSTITGAINSTFEAMAKAVIGESNYQTLSTEFKKANRIYQAATNTLNLLYDSMAGIAEGLEIVGKYHAKVGNALLRSGQILEDSFGWMNETLHFKTGKIGVIDRVIRGLQTAQEVSEDIEQVTSNLRSAQENINEIGEEWERVNAENTAAETTKKTEETATKTASKSPEISLSDLIKPLPPEN